MGAGCTPTKSAPMTISAAVATEIPSAMLILARWEGRILARARGFAAQAGSTFNIAARLSLSCQNSGRS
jgi:hypothetical protein